MPSPAEPILKSDLRRWTDAFTVWNRKLHYYVGLYLLCFMWLFAFSGLLLNHSSWAFAQFFANRKITKFERAIQPLPAGTSDLDQAGDLLRQLGIEGEVLTRPRTDPTRFEVNVTRPGRVYQLQADLPKSRVIVTATEYNTWGVLRTLHTFMGGGRGNRDNWALTKIWAFSMDAVAAGIIFMVLSSFYMWWRLKEKRVGGIIALALGTVVGGLFVFGLAWLLG